MLHIPWSHTSRLRLVLAEMRLVWHLSVCWVRQKRRTMQEGSIAHMHWGERGEGGG